MNEKKKEEEDNVIKNGVDDSSNSNNNNNNGGNNKKPTFRGPIRSLNAITLKKPVEFKNNNTSSSTTTTIKPSPSPSMIIPTKPTLIVTPTTRKEINGIQTQPTLSTQKPPAQNASIKKEGETKHVNNNNNNNNNKHGTDQSDGNTSAIEGGSYTYCKVCSINHTQGKKHLYMPFHKENLQRLLNPEKQQIQDTKYFMKNLFSKDKTENDEGIGTSTMQEQPYKCLFCEMEVETSGNRFVGFSALKHLSLSKHHKNVENWMRSSGALGKGINWGDYWVTTEDFNTFLHKTGEALKTKVQNKLDTLTQTPKKEMYVPPIMTKSTSLYFDSSIIPQQINTNTILNDHNNVNTPTTSESGETNENDQPTKVYKTVISNKGIKQNQTGFDEGVRVWGGGIVKIKKSDWLPWPIDLIDSQEGSFLLTAEAASSIGGWITPALENSFQQNKSNPTEENFLRKTSKAVGESTTLLLLMYHLWLRVRGMFFQVLCHHGFWMIMENQWFPI